MNEADINFYFHLLCPFAWMTSKDVGTPIIHFGPPRGTANEPITLVPHGATPRGRGCR